MPEMPAAQAESPGASARLLEALVDKEIITQEQADQIRRRTRRTGTGVVPAIFNLGLASEEDVYRVMADNAGVDFVDLQTVEVEDKAVEETPAKVAFHYKMIPLERSRSALRAAFAAPPGMRDRENLRLLLGVRIDPVVATPSSVRQTLKRIYGLGAETVLQIRQDRSLQQRASQTVSYDGVLGQDLADDEESASIIRLVNQILLEALEVNATDIHMEPMPKDVKLRYRIDGMLRDVPTPPGIRELHESVVTRMKIMADLNIAEKRLPHDGRIRVRIGDEQFDLRVSILPTRFGETLCLRILNRAAIFLEMDQLGLNPKQLVLLNRLVNLPHGIVLVTGPTGSGKTTTLYAALAKTRTDNPDRKIITVEDPVEYELEGTTQIQIRSDIGLTFAAGLRSILRHDPDIILVGEIRDSETAEIAIRSSLTGHLVLSTLHTNDSVGAINRLVDMGVEPYLVASSVSASMAQRLVRRICPHCKTEDVDIAERVRTDMARALEIEESDVRAYKGTGCNECNQSGYRGRVAILEIFLLDEEIQDMVSAHAPTADLRRKARDKGMRTLRDAGWEKVAAGLTSVSEVTRITGNLLLTYEVAEDEAKQAGDEPQPVK